MKEKTAIQELLDWYAAKGSLEPESPEGLYIRATHEYAQLRAEFSRLTERAENAERRAEKYRVMLNYKHSLLVRVEKAIGKRDFKVATEELKEWPCTLPSALINEIDEEVF